MAHFAQIDENNIVTRVVVIANEDTADENGVEDESIGIAFCKSLWGEDTNWVQTSYNANFRHNYAGIGFKYDPEYDAFIPPRRWDSWTLNTETFTWDPPIPAPDMTHSVYCWDEDAYQADNTKGWFLC